MSGGMVTFETGGAFEVAGQIFEHADLAVPGVGRIDVEPQGRIGVDVVNSAQGPAESPTQDLSISGTQFILNGGPWYPRGVNCRGLLAPQWYSDGGASDNARDNFTTANRDLWRTLGVRLTRWQISQVGIMDPARTSQERADYLSYVLDGINLVRSEGFSCIVSCQDQSGGGGPAASTPSARTVTFWETLAPYFADDSGVMFEAFNEPQTNSSQAVQWRDGGGLNNLGETRVGHQAILDTIRLSNTNVVLVSGGSFGHTLEGTTALVDPLNNYGYVIHPYNYDSLGSAAAWATPYAGVPAVAPVIATEWGFFGTAGTCASSKKTLARPLLDFLLDNNIGVTAHAGDIDGWIFNTLVAQTITDCDTAVPGMGRTFLNWVATL